MNRQNARIAQYGDMTDAEIAEGFDHGPGCDGPYNCTCEDRWPDGSARGRACGACGLFFETVAELDAHECDLDPRFCEPPADEPEGPDADVAPECPAGGEHSPVEVTGYPTDPSGRCETFWVCEACGTHFGHAGWDSVL